jgi:hypothetical protein
VGGVRRAVFQDSREGLFRGSTRSIIEAQSGHRICPRTSCNKTMRSFSFLRLHSIFTRTAGSTLTNRAKDVIHLDVLATHATTLGLGRREGRSEPRRFKGHVGVLLFGRRSRPDYRGCIYRSRLVALMFRLQSQIRPEMRYPWRG